MSAAHTLTILMREDARDQYDFLSRVIDALRTQHANVQELRYKDRRVSVVFTETLERCQLLQKRLRNMRSVGDVLEDQVESVDATLPQRTALVAQAAG